MSRKTAVVISEIHTCALLLLLARYFGMDDVVDKARQADRLRGAVLLHLAPSTDHVDFGQIYG